MKQVDNNPIISFLGDKKYRLYRHVLLQLFVLIVSSSVLFEDSGELNLSADRLYALGGLWLVINLIIYANIYFLVPRYLFKGSLLRYIFFAFLLLLASSILLDIFEIFFFNPDREFSAANLTNAILNVLGTVFTLGLVIVGVATCMLLKKWMEENIRVEQLKAATLQVELEFLKSQINPHFLFNMLNNANILAKNKPELASEILTKLDDLLCYQINDSTRDKVYLSADIAFLRDFLDLEKTRRDEFEYTISKEGDINNVQVAPLLFIPFVENAIKHNHNHEGLSYIHLSFSVHQNILKFCCVNSVAPEEEQEEVKKVGGLGLANIQRRLDLLYKDNYMLTQSKTDVAYTLNLELKL